MPAHLPLADVRPPSGVPHQRRAPELHILAHTHWDREWYHTAEEFGPALAALVDELLDDAGAPPFLLDGQAIVLADYLAVRPGRHDELARALREGRLEAGPWFVLADTLIPSGEALVRNLAAGVAQVRALGASPPPVLYCPDAFGHPAALPRLAAGFGMPVIVAWRGFGGARWPAGDTVRWRDGDAEALLFHLPPDGYEGGANLPNDEDGARARWAALQRVLVPRSSLGILLLLNGADHHALQHGHAHALAALQRAAAPIPVLRSTLRGFATRLITRAADASLPVVEGELRDSTGYTWALQGTFATRAAQKRTNAAAERLLLRDVEPWVALAGWFARADTFPGGHAPAPGQMPAPANTHAFAHAPAFRHDLHAVWRALLACHPHDTLCGCAIDAVAAAMEHRLDIVLRGGAEVGRRARAALVGHDAATAHGREGEWQHVLVVRNRTAHPRAGVAELVVDVARGAVPVGPGSRATAREPAGDTPSALRIGDPPVPLQLVDRERTFAREESPRHYPRNVLVERRRYLAWLPEVAAWGLAVHPVREAPASPPHRSPIPSPVRAHRGRAISTGSLRLSAQENESLELRHPLGTIADLITIESVGERGDLYTHSPIPGTASRATLRSARITRRGPLRGELTLVYLLPIAARSLHAATGTPIAHPATSLRLEVRAQLDASSPLVRLRVTGSNHAHDHRVRLVVRTGIATSDLWCDAAFGVVRRPSEGAPRAPEGAPEEPWRAAPLHRYVSRFGTGEGCTVFSDGLAEYEATAGGDVAITLLRATGELSRNDLPERPGHAGWPTSTPSAQSEGPFEAMIGIMPHGGRTDDVIVAIERSCDDFLLPLTGTSWRSAIAPPALAGGLALEGQGLAFSSCRPADDGNALVLRCVNRLSRPVQGAWRVAGLGAAALARLDGHPLGDLAVADDRVSFVAPPNGVVTILAFPRSPAR